VTKLTLDEALRQVLEDDNKISKYEARVLHDLILSDGKVTDEEKQFLKKCIEENSLDEQAMKILSDLLVRADLSRR